MALDKYSMKIALYILASAFYAISSSTGYANEPEPDKTVTIFAAASTSQAVEAIKKTYEIKNPDIKIRVSYGASALLARQISKGAPADLFLSANAEWLNWLESKLKDKSITKPVIISHNRLMLISGKSEPTLSCPPLPSQLAHALRDKRFVLADPNVAPLGQYSKQALIALKLWKTVEPSLAIASNANLTLKMIERGAGPYGIAYASGTMNNTLIKDMCLLPASSHKSINYYLVPINMPSEATTSFADYLAHESDQHWIKAGFYTPTSHATSNNGVK